MSHSGIDTIFALSSGILPSGVAVVRVSGTKCSRIIEDLGLGNLTPRMAALKRIITPTNGELLDTGLCLWFPGPGSFTGEDCLELQVHGGRAVVSKILEVLSGFENCRLALPGEFSRRAFENGKLDLTEIEGLADLISADTEWQRKQAQAQADGRFRSLLESWREELIRCRAFLEVEFDFSDEDDVPDSMVDAVKNRVLALQAEIRNYLDDGNRGEIIRDGYSVVLAGAPNSGKSSLLNALAGRDIAIVNNRAGTTRDVLECKLDIDGIPVILYDTAGIRETEDEIELEGIKRALAHGKKADLTIWLSALDEPVGAEPSLSNTTTFYSKNDLGMNKPVNSINTIEADGLSPLLLFIKERLKDFIADYEPALVTRQRHRSELGIAVLSLQKSATLLDTNMVLAGEELRIASDCMGRLTGFIDVEDLLDVIFSEFCIGK